MGFDFEADRRHAAMHGYEPATSSLPMLIRCGQHQHPGGVEHLAAVTSQEAAPPTSRECLPVEPHGVPDARPLVDDPYTAAWDFS